MALPVGSHVDQGRDEGRSKPDTRVWVLLCECPSTDRWLRLLSANSPGFCTTGRSSRDLMTTKINYKSQRTHLQLPNYHRTSLALGFLEALSMGCSTNAGRVRVLEPRQPLEGVRDVAGSEPTSRMKSDHSQDEERPGSRPVRSPMIEMPSKARDQDCYQSQGRLSVYSRDTITLHSSSRSAEQGKAGWITC
jgi:hypothetical protein